MKNLGVIFLLLFSLIKGTEARALSPEAEISLLTSAPYEAEVFTVYGHAALRVSDPGQKIDVVFNYGMFSFDKPFFIYRFVKGETDYMLGVMPYAHYAVEYQMRGSTVTEQVLDLTPAERETIWKALVENARPENREYRYNFFFDNCSTRPAEIIEQNVEGGVDYSAWQPESLTFRDMINYCTRNKPWLTFGCDLVLGTPTDRTATPHEMLFLPGYLKEAFSKATIGEGEQARKLVKETRQYEAVPDEAEETVVTPAVVAWAVLVLVAGITGWEIKKKKYVWGIDVVLFTVAGLAGCLLFFLSFISEHPSIFPNWNLMWLQPLHLLSPLFFCIRKGAKAFYYYHFINFAALLAALVGWIIVPQHLNAAFIPLIISLLVRSWQARGFGKQLKASAKTR